MDAEGSGDVPDRFSLLQQPSGELELLVVHLLWPSKADAALARVGAASTGALTDADGKTINFYMEPQYSVWRSGLGAPGWQLFTGVNFQFPVHFQFGSRQTR